VWPGIAPEAAWPSSSTPARHLAPVSHRRETTSNRREEVWARQTASHLPRLKDLDGFDTRFLAPAIGIPFGQRWACCPFGVAAGRDALGPEGARRVRGEMDHETVRINMVRAAALVCLATGIGGLELDAHDYSVMK